MEIFPEEKSIAKLMENNKASTIASALKINPYTEEKVDLLIKSLSSIKDNPIVCKALAQISNNPDLMCGSAILVSTVMNLNDDVFVPDQVWLARNTIVNTPYNNQHVAQDIIGHIIGEKALDKFGNEIDQYDPDTTDYMDIEVEFVMYKEIFPELAKEIEAGAANNTKFVSMECIFNNFDYAIVDDQNNVKIIERNKNTAFLTKYLRAYNGTGRYNNSRIGRVLKDFRFSGMGNVDVPANPKSEYTSIGKLNFVSLEENKNFALYIIKGKTMKIENMEQADAEIQKLLAEVTQLKANLEGKDNSISDLTKKNADLTTQVSAEELKTKAAQETITSLNTEITTVKADLTVKTEALDKINKEAKANDRQNKLKDAGVNLEAKDVEVLASWSDEQFESVLKFTKSIKPVVQAQEVITIPVVIEVQETEKKVDPTATAGENKNPQQEMSEIADKLVASLLAKRKSKMGKKSGKKSKNDDMSDDENENS